MSRFTEVHDGQKFDIGQAIGGFLASAGNKVTGAQVQDCVACQYIWLQVEQDTSEEGSPVKIFDSFLRNCIDAQKTKIFYTSCSMMLDVQDDLIRMYYSDIPVKKMCTITRFCQEDTSMGVEMWR